MNPLPTTKPPELINIVRQLEAASQVANDLRLPFLRQLIEMALLEAIETIYGESE